MKLLHPSPSQFRSGKREAIVRTQTWKWANWSKCGCCWLGVGKSVIFSPPPIAEASVAYIWNFHILHMHASHERQPYNLPPAEVKLFSPLYTSGGLITRVDVCTQDLRVRKSGSKSGCFWHGVGKSETLLTTSDFRSNHSQCENLNLLQFPHFPIFSSIQVPELKITLKPTPYHQQPDIASKNLSVHVPSSWVKLSPHPQFRKQNRWWYVHSKLENEKIGEKICRL